VIPLGGGWRRLPRWLFPVNVALADGSGLKIAVGKRLALRLQLGHLAVFGLTARGKSVLLPRAESGGQSARWDVTTIYRSGETGTERT